MVRVFVRLDDCECLPGGVPRLLSGHSLPTRDCSVHIERIDLDAVTLPTGALRGKYGRAAAAKGIENDVIALRRIQNGVGNQCNRLDRGMEIKSAFLTFTRKAVGASVIPDVRAIAPEAAELNIIEVRFLAVSDAAVLARIGRIGLELHDRKESEPATL